DTSLADAPDAPDTEAPETEPTQGDVADTRSAEPSADTSPAPTTVPEPPADRDTTTESRPADAGSPPVPTRFADIKPVAESSDLDAEAVSAVLLSPDDTPTPEPDAYGDIAAAGGTGTNSGDSPPEPPKNLPQSRP